MKKSTWIILILVVFLAIFFKGFRLGERYTFDWDQSDDALKTMSMIWDKKPALIGPRVASENGFFVGPFHYYLLLPFYISTQGHPLAGAYFMIVVSVATVLAYFFVGRNIYNEKVGLVAAFIAAISTSVNSWNAIYIPLFSILGFFLCLKQLESDKYFYWLVILSGLSATTHLVPASLVPLALFSIFLSARKPGWKKLLKGLAIFGLFFLPIIVFDLRHQFLNVNKLFEFIFSQNVTGEASFNRWLFLRSFWRSLTIFDGFKAIGTPLLEYLFALISLVYGIFRHKSSRSKWFTFLWLVFPLLIMSKYKGNIPEYYFGMVGGLLPLFISILLIDLLPIWLVGIFGIFLFYIQFKVIKGVRPTITLKDKEAVVTYIAKTQKTDPVFNVSYNLPLGTNNGYQFLFKLYRHEPVSGPEGHLYTISDTVYPKDNVVFKTGSLYVIRR